MENGFFSNRRNWLTELLSEIYQVSSTLFRLMIPVLLLVLSCFKSWE